MAQQPLRTLGGFGAGGMNGNGFGDPVANDYAGIDWGYDFQTGMIINGWNNPQAAANYANSMAKRTRLMNQRYNRSFDQRKPTEFDRFIKDIETRYPFLK